ncbi:MAG: trimeric intracellular cation channel family protein [Candidatus Nanopelagicaceae bacterium]
MSALPLYVDLAAVGVGAFAGALFAIFNKRFDFIGVIAIAIMTSLGGGLIRDLFLGVGRPSALQDNNYIITVIIAVIAALLLGRWYNSSKKIAAKIVLVLDSISMGLFTVAGTYKALLFNAPVTVAILLGVITAVGGGVLRDVLARRTPAIFTGGPLYATATFIGASLFVILDVIDLNRDLASAITVLTIVSIHMLSIRFELHMRPAVESLDFDDPEATR